MATTLHTTVPPTDGTSGGAPELEHVEPVARAIRRIRGAVVTATSAAYVATMISLTAVVATSSRLDPATGILGLVAGSAATTLVAVLLVTRILGHVDALGRRSMELTDLYDRARHDALRDGLTGLGNHRAFQEELDRAAQMSRRHGQPTALLLLDVDDLKRTNDTDGHEAGDEVLRSVARVMLSNLRRVDRPFRIGGDEFAILSPGTTIDGAVAVGRRILAAALETRDPTDQRAISVTIGISAIPDPSADRRQLYRHADAALYWGKRHGRTDVLAYDPQLHGVADDDRPAEEIAAAIDRLIDERLLRPVFQPVFSLRDGHCLGFEGLVRPLPGAGFRSAGALFVAGESVSRTVELDLAAIRGIAAGARDLQAPCYLAVNLSPRTLEAAAFNPHEITAILGGAGIDPQRVVVELTEREAIEDIDQLVRNLDAFRRVGARIALDDVGAGNAGLQLLSRVDFDVLKIDLSLVQSGAVVAPSRSVLRALIEMAHRRGATTVAEGIETPFQLEVLRDLGIEVGQGYLLGVPREQLDGTAVDLERILGRIDGEGAAADAEPADEVFAA